MVIGLLTLAAIPTVTGVSEAIAQREKPHSPKSAAHEERQLRRFHLRTWCQGLSAGKRDIHQGLVVVGDGGLWIQSPTAPIPSRQFPAFEGFFIEYPDGERVPPELGLVVQVTFDPPLLNWVYIDDRGRVHHGNRTDSKPYSVGNWGTTDDFEDSDEVKGPGGLEFEGEERFVAVEPRPGRGDGRWEVWWDRDDDKLATMAEIKGRLVHRISLEREYKEQN